MINTKETPFRELIKSFKEDFIVQLPVKQSKRLAAFNESSVNTIKINTVMLDDKVEVMSAFLRVGSKGCFADNQGTERYFIGITKEGRFRNYAIKHNLERVDSIPSGTVFAGIEVPAFEKAKELVKEAHKCFPRFGMCFWDVCIDENEEPAIIELNLQNPTVYFAQAACGYSFFGDWAERIINAAKDGRKDDYNSFF